RRAPRRARPQRELLGHEVLPDRCLRRRGLHVPAPPAAAGPAFDLRSAAGRRSAAALFGGGGLRWHELQPGLPRGLRHRLLSRVSSSKANPGLPERASLRERPSRASTKEPAPVYRDGYSRRLTHALPESREVGPSRLGSPRLQPALSHDE